MAFMPPSRAYGETPKARKWHTFMCHDFGMWHTNVCLYWVACGVIISGRS